MNCSSVGDLKLFLLLTGTVEPAWSNSFIINFRAHDTVKNFLFFLSVINLLFSESITPEHTPAMQIKTIYKSMLNSFK